MKKRTLTVVSMACLLSQATPVFALSPEQKLAQDYELFFKQQVAAENVTGTAFVVASPDGIVRIGTAGHTDTSRKQRINENTTFRVASVSKTFAAGLTGVLINEGEFKWEDRLVDYVLKVSQNNDVALNGFDWDQSPFKVASESARFMAATWTATWNAADKVGFVNRKKGDCGMEKALKGWEALILS